MQKARPDKRIGQKEKLLTLGHKNPVCSSFGVIYFYSFYFSGLRKGSQPESMKKERTVAEEKGEIGAWKIRKNLSVQCSLTGKTVLKSWRDTERTLSDFQSLASS